MGSYDRPALRHHFSNEFYEEVEETFKMMDKEGDGVINRAELILALKALGMLSAQDLVNEEHENATELVTFEDYVSAIVKHKENPHWCHQEIAEAFYIFDRDVSGGLESVEVKRVLTKLGEVVSDQVLKSTPNLELLV